jgi:hypothetical protein
VLAAVDPNRSGRRPVTRVSPSHDISIVCMPCTVVSSDGIVLGPFPQVREMELRILREELTP